MKAYKIPEENKDLRKYALWKNLKYLIFYILYIAFFSLAFLYYVKGNHLPLDLWVYPVFFLAVIVSGWLVCFMTRFCSDRSFTGRIKEMKYSRNYGRGLSRSASFSVDYHTYLKLTAVRRDGKRRRVKIHLFEDGYDGYYRDGGTLVKFRGLSYPLCLESEAEGTHLCGVCGVRTYYKNGKMIHGEAEPEMRDGLIVCRSCGHTLINIDKTEDRS